MIVKTDGSFAALMISNTNIYVATRYRWHLVGVVSWGGNCEEGLLTPGVYADVISFRTWILDTMGTN